MPTESAERFFTPRRPVIAEVSGQDGIGALAWHSLVEPAVVTEFRARLSLVVFDSMALVRIRHTAAEIHRTAPHVEALAAGSTFYFVLSGSMTARQDGREFALDAGSAVILSGLQPFHLSCPGPVDLVIVVLRRRALEGRGIPRAEHEFCRVRRSSFVTASTAFLASLSADPPRPGSAEGVTAQHTVVQLLTGAMLASIDEHDPGATSRRAGSRSNALAYIAANYANPRLTTADVALAAGISTRHLQRALAESGTSVADELKRVRMRWAVALLTQPDRRAVSVQEIASLTGFGSLPRMRRAFLADYGVTPSQFRSHPPAEAPGALSRSAS